MYDEEKTHSVSSARLYDAAFRTSRRRSRIG